MLWVALSFIHWTWNIPSERCIDPETQYPIQAALVQSAMKELHFNIRPNKDVKSQAVALIPELAKVGDVKILHLNLVQ